MTSAKPNHKAARALMLRHLDLHPGESVADDLDPLEAGIVPDRRHRGGYHCGAGRVLDPDYSVNESPRDRRGLDGFASAVDYGYFRIRTVRGVFDLYDYNRWLVGLCEAGDPDTADLREVIYSPDGKAVKRWDALGRRSSGDSSHRGHTHHSEFRDADGHRMLRLATRWLQHIGVIPQEDDVQQADIDKIVTAVVSRVDDVVIAVLEGERGKRALAQAFNADDVLAAPGFPKPGKNADGTPVNTHWAAASFLRDAQVSLTNLKVAVTNQGRVLASLVGKDHVDELALAGVLAPLILAGLPAGSAPVSQEQLEAALRTVFAQVGEG